MSKARRPGYSQSKLSAGAALLRSALTLLLYFIEDMGALCTVGLQAFEYDIRERASVTSCRDIFDKIALRELRSCPFSNMLA